TESSALFLHKMPREIFGARCKVAAHEFARNNALSQFFIGRAFKALGKVCNFCHDMSTKFDEDSSTTIAFKARLKYYRGLQMRVLMLSNKVLQERQQGSRTNRMNKIFDAADRLKNQAIREGKVLMDSVFKKKKAKVIDPFVQWDASEDKTEIRVNWMEEGDVTKNVKIGSILVDVDAPGNVAREYCRRFLREELNKRVGERFLLVAKGEGLPIVEEITKRIGQLAPQKFNAETREIEHTLTITANKDKDLEPLQVPAIKSEDMKRKEDEMEKKRLWSLVIEDRKYKEVEMSSEKREELTKELVNAGVKEKKVKKCFNRDGKLVSIVYNDTTRNMDAKARRRMKVIVDECLGIDTQGEHNFEIDGKPSGGGEAGEGGEKEGGEKVEEEQKAALEVKAAAPPEEQEQEEEGLEDWGDVPAQGTEGGGWEIYQDDQGYDYYYHTATGDSQYEVPEGLGK
ncbi:hypothetical protein TrRE_jg12116, partial [Triparma retinervis]